MLSLNNNHASISLLPPLRKEIKRNAGDDSGLCIVKRWKENMMMIAVHVLA